ncbi:hypothetical protein BHE74_00028580, partial [Ensete ventricosum]
GERRLLPRHKSWGGGGMAKLGRERVADGTTSPYPPTCLEQSESLRYRTQSFSSFALSPFNPRN